MFDIDPDTLHARLAQARDRAQRSLVAWDQYHRAVIPEEAVDEVKAREACLRRELAALGDWTYRTRAAQRVLWGFRSRFARLLGQERLGWFPAALLIATPPAALCLVPLLLLSPGLVWTLLGFAGALLTVFIPVAALLYSLEQSEYDANPDRLDEWLQQRRGAIRATRQEWEQTRAHWARLGRIRAAEAQYQRARQEVLSLEQVLADRRYQLMHRDWRSLRGVDFEDFLADVFRELGYHVETTKASGDQGVDLIVTGKGRRIAVQAKGYADPVSNSAIQQVHTGMVFYQCVSCVAITNSRFTGPAQTLAVAVGCLLVDGSRIPDLIAGRIL